jgi:hypothetical protein
MVFVGYSAAEAMAALMEHKMITEPRAIPSALLYRKPPDEERDNHSHTSRYLNRFSANRISH